jgi:hypothetical protein
MLPLTLEGPWRDDLQSISYLFFLEYPAKGVGSFETAYTLTIVIPVTI